MIQESKSSGEQNLEHPMKNGNFALKCYENLGGKVKYHNETEYIIFTGL